MPSAKPAEPLDELARELDLASDESEKLWCIRRLNAMGPGQYLDFLLAVTRDLPASRAISGPDEPFEL